MPQSKFDFYFCHQHIGHISVHMNESRRIGFQSFISFFLSTLRVSVGKLRFFTKPDCRFIKNFTRRLTRLHDDLHSRFSRVNGRAKYNSHCNARSVELFCLTRERLPCQYSDKFKVRNASPGRITFQFPFTWPKANFIVRRKGREGCSVKQS